MTILGGRAFVTLYYVVFLAAVGLTIYSFVQAVSSWDQVKEIKKESSDGILILPDLYMCLPAESSQNAFNSGGWRRQAATNLSGQQTEPEWTTNGAMFHGNRYDKYNGGKRCNGLSPSWGGESFDKSYPCIEAKYSHKTLGNLNDLGEGKEGDSLFMVNDNKKWDHPDSYYAKNGNNEPVLSAMSFQDGMVYDGSGFSMSKYKPKQFEIDATATKFADALAKQRRENEGDTLIKTRCFVMKNPLNDKGEGKLRQSRAESEKDLRFSFKLNVGVTHRSARSYFYADVWFLKPGDTDFDFDAPPPRDVEVPLVNSMVDITLTVEKITDLTKGTKSERAEKTKYKSSVQTNNQRLYHEPPESHTFKGQFAWTRFSIAMDTEASVVSITRRGLNLSDITIEIGALGSFFFLIIGTFFIDTGLRDEHGNAISVFVLMSSSKTTQLLKQVPLFRGASYSDNSHADGPSGANLQQIGKEPL